MSEERVVWLDGKLLPEDAARVPASSTALQLGVGVFETLRLVDGVAPLLDRHLARLARAAAALGLDGAGHDWRAALHEVASHNPGDAVARITLGEDLALVTTRSLPDTLAAERRDGVALQRSFVAWPCADIKSTSRAALRRAEHEAGGHEVALCRGDRLLETSRSNLFCVSDRGIETASPPSVLAGVARQAVLELARELDFVVRRRAPRWSERSAWHEVFVSNAVRGVRPVARIDDETWTPAPDGSATRALQSGLDRRMGLC